ncbi:flagellar hook-basal body protein [Siminovitchia sp. 179-K 8D1 HS]|uniref:flagellar hook-basal body protein n=1 Tax=Siminovitchia sp. 179-K 8D1 HS TaxID=3142385 RepID=UPI0039A11625
MNRTMITAVNTLNQLQKQIDLISHNIANSETNGYKKREASFADLIAQQINNQPNTAEEAGRTSAFGIRQSVGARLSQAAMIVAQGSLKTTGRPFDMAFTKENQYLKVRAQNGSVQFTRNGQLGFQLAQNGEFILTTKEGHPVLTENNQSITVPSKVEQWSMIQPGLFEARLANGQQMRFRLGVISLTNPQFMEQKGGSLIGIPDELAGDVNPEALYTELNGERSNEISIQPAALESSNVDIGKEMTDLMTAQRSIQFQSRSVTIADQMTGLVNGIR